MGRYRAADGSIVEADDAYARTVGLEAVTEEENYDAIGARARDVAASERGLLGTINAAATSALSGATLGLSDVALGSLMTEGEREALRGDRHANEGVSTAANIIGGLATSVAAPGSLLARTPAGAVAQVANRGVAAGRAAGGVGGAARVIGYSGAEAAAQSAGSYLSDVALGDRELSAEGLAGAVGRGFAFGAVAGGAVHGIEKGTIAARRLFPKVGAAKEVQLAETAWTNKSTEIFDAHDEMAAAARKAIDDARVAQAEAVATRARIDGDIAARRAELADMPQPERVRVPSDDLPRAVDDVPAATVADGVPARTPDAPAPTQSPDPVNVPGVDGSTITQTPKQPFTQPPQSLEAQLAEMQAQVSKGATLQDLNAARTVTPKQVEAMEEALADYQTAREKVNAWVERIRNPRVQHHGINVEAPTNAASGFGRIRQTFATDVPVEQSHGGIRIIGAKENTLDSLTPNSRLIGADVVPDRELGRAMDEEYHEAIDMARTSATAEERAFALQQAAGIDDRIHELARGQRPEVDAVIDRIEALRAQHGRSTLSAAEQRLARQQKRFEEAGEKHFLPAPEIQPGIKRAPTRKPDLPASAAPKPPSTVEEAAEAADVLGEYEQAAAKLADAVGDSAPAAAKEARDGLRKAEGEAERKSFDRAARAVDDHARGVRSKDEKLTALQKEKRQADVALKRAKQSEAEAKAQLQRAEIEIANRPAAKNPADAVSLPAPTADAQSGRLSSLADMGAVLEAADTIGIPGLPRPSDLPVVGPLLGLYLKYRAVKTIAGRMTGRVPATGDAKAAALAAKTKDRALQAVDRLLGFVERSTPTARNLSVRVGGRLVDALSKPMTDDVEKPDGDSLPQLAAARARELSNAVANPQMIAARVRRELADIADPDLIAAAEAFELRKIQHLHEHAPKEPSSGTLTRRKWEPSMTQATKFARRAAVADDPIAALEAVESRSITPDQADTLRTLYPRIFASCQERLIERTAEIRETVPRDQRFRLALLFDVPLDRLSEPDTLALLQSSSVSSAPTTISPAAPTQPPVPSLAGPVDLTALYTTPSDRRAARR